MNKKQLIVVWIIGLMLLGGCASTKLLEDKDNPANANLEQRNTSHLGVKTTVGF